MMGITTYNDAVSIVSQYGLENNCDSLIDTISMMEDNRDSLSGIQLMCLEIVIGDMENYYAL